MAITGIIRPPPEIRAVADKTAAYVAKNGRGFETKIMNSARGKTPKFAFLHQTSPFHAYYEDRIQFYANGGTDEPEEKKDVKPQTTEAKTVEEKTAAANTTSSAIVVKKKEKTQKASAIDPIAKALLTQRNKILQAKKQMEEKLEKEKSDDAMDTGRRTTTTTLDMILPPPAPLELVTVVAPFNLTQTQIETIQLVAQFTAMDGKGGPFLHQLTLREWSNPEFAFCQPRHSHFAYFSALVDAYRKILREWVGAAGTKETNETTKQEPTKESSEKKALQVLDEAAFRAEYEREMKLQLSQQQQEEGEISAIDWNDFVVVETIDFPADEMVEAMLPPPTTLTTTGPPSAAVGLPKRSEDAMDESSDEDDQGETIRVVPSYKPKVVGASDLSSARAIDPITGKSVAVADLPEHMRIQLLDPKWAEERKKFQEKQKDSNLVSGDAVVANIARLTQSQEKATASSLPIASASAQAGIAKRAMGLPPPLANPAAASSAPSQMAEPAAKRPRLDMPAAASQPPPQAAAAPPEPRAEVVEETAPADTEEKKVMSEEEFAASLDSPDVKLQVRIPNDAAQMAWNFYGQIVSLSVNVMTTVKDVKAQLSKSHLNDMPSNKILLKAPKGGFLSNNATLASLNIGPTATLEMSLKQRGGRK